MSIKVDLNYIWKSFLFMKDLYSKYVVLLCQKKVGNL